MLRAMFEDYSKNSRFLKWLETVAAGNSQAYPQRETLAEDAAAFLARWDRARKENRVLEERYRKLAVGVATLTESSPKLPPEALSDALTGKFQALTETTQEQARNLETVLEAKRTELQQAQAELEQTRNEITTIKSKLESEQRKLDPVLRYAYNLRRLVQRIHAIGKLTPEIRGYIEQMLEAGGVSLQRDKNQVPRTSNSQQPKTTYQQSA